jgi:hypothetical protein
MSTSAPIVDSPLRQANIRLRRHVGGRTRAQDIADSPTSASMALIILGALDLARRLRKFRDEQSEIMWASSKRLEAA